MKSQREAHLIGYKKKVACPPPHACKTQLVRELCQNCKCREKKDGAVHIGFFPELFAPHAQQVIQTFATVCFFTHTDWFYAVNLFCSSLNSCFCLQITVHRLAVLLTIFWRKNRAKSVSAEKWKSEACRSYFFCFSMKLQFHNT